MRTRENSLHLRFTDEEISFMRSQADKCGLRMQAYVQKLIRDKPIKEQPDVQFFTIIKQLSQIGNNMNQIAVVANSKGFIDAKYYRENVDWIRKVVGDLMEAMYT